MGAVCVHHSIILFTTIRNNLFVYKLFIDWLRITTVRTTMRTRVPAAGNPVSSGRTLSGWEGDYRRGYVLEDVERGDGF